MAPEQPSQDHADRLDIVEALRRNAALVLSTALIAGLAAFVFSVVQEDAFEATAEVLIEAESLQDTVTPRRAFPTTDPSREALTDLELINTGEVAALAAEKLGDEVTVGDIQADVEATRTESSDVVEVAAVAADPELAAAMANAVAESYIEFRRRDSRDRITRAQELVAADLRALDPDDRSGATGRALRAQLARLTALRSLQTGDARVITAADAPEGPAAPKPLRNSVVGGLLGLLVGIGLALLRERVDRRARRSSDLERWLGLPLLASIGESAALRAEPTSADGHRVDDGEQFRLLRTRLRYFNADRDLRTLLVTSPSAGDGKTTVARGLAAACAAAGESTLLVEADMSQPAPARDGATAAPDGGLAEVLSGQLDFEDACRPAGPESALHVLASGTPPPDPSRLLESRRAGELFEQLADRYSFVVIDAPAITERADAIPLARLVDGVVVVGRLGRTVEEDARSLRRQLEGLGAAGLGVVANFAGSREERPTK